MAATWNNEETLKLVVLSTHFEIEELSGIQRESHLVSCFISTSNALAMEHPGYLDMKGWGKDKQNYDDCPLSSTLRYGHTSTCIVVFRKIGQKE